MRTPTVHLNGTGAEELLRQLREAAESVSTAIDKVKAAAPHPRDYYVQSGEAGLIATREHIERLRRLEEVHDELATMWRDVFAQSVKALRDG